MNLLILFSRKISHLLLFILVAGCAGPGKMSSAFQNQGIAGHVIFKEGTFFLNGELRDSGKVYGVEREIFIYKKTSVREVDLAENGFVKSIHSDLVTVEFTDDLGNFKIPLAPGEYSIFILENERFYSKFNNEDEFYFPIKVEENKFVEVLFEVDYQAVYP